MRRAFFQCPWLCYGRRNKEQKVHETILAYPRSMTSFRDAIEKGEVAKAGNLFRKSNSSTNREKGKGEIGLKTYLVVGYVPRIMKDEYIKNSESAKQKPVESQRPEIVIS